MDQCERPSVRSDQCCIRVSQQLTLVSVASLAPCILTVLTKMIAKLRWEESSYIPLSRVRCRRTKFEDNMLIWKLKGRSHILENTPPNFRQYEGVSREQSRAVSRIGY